MTNDVGEIIVLLEDGAGNDYQTKYKQIYSNQYNKDAYTVGYANGISGKVSDVEKLIDGLKRKLTILLDTPRQPP